MKGRNKGVRNKRTLQLLAHILVVAFLYLGGKLVIAGDSCCFISSTADVRMMPS
jgi:hypothetical protein